MASASKLEMVCRTLRGVLLSEKGGVAIHRLQSDFRELTGTPLQFKEFGYPSLEAFLGSIPKVVSLQRGPDGAVLCKCVTDDTTQHIGSLVNRQKGKKKGRGSGMRMQPGRPRGCPSRSNPFYGNPFNPSRKPQPVSPKFRTKTPILKLYKPATQQPSFQYSSGPKPAVSSGGPPKPAPQLIPQNNAPGLYHQSTTRTQSTRRPGSTSTRSASVSVTAAQQPTPRPWSGKLGSKRNQQSANSTLKTQQIQPEPQLTTTRPTATQQKKVYENIYITVENDAVTKGKAKPKNSECSPNFESGKATCKKPEWSASFDVPPRFKKMMSPNGTTLSDNQSAAPDTTFDTTPHPPVRTSPSQDIPSATQISGITPDWIQKIMKEKANGIWASALCEMHMEEFGSSLDMTIIDQMAEQNLLLKEETVINNVILYPKLTVTIKDTPTSKVPKRTVTFSAGDQQEVGAATEKMRNQTTQSCPEGKPNITPPLTTSTPPTTLPGPQDNALTNPSMTSILRAKCQRQNLPLKYKTERETVLGKPYFAVHCTAGSQVAMAYGSTENAAIEGASANILYQWNTMPKELSQDSRPSAGREELHLRFEHQAGFCDCSATERDNDCKALRSLKRISSKPSDEWVVQQNRTLTPSASMPQRTKNFSQVERLAARAARFGLNSKAMPEVVDSHKPTPLMSFSQGRAEKFCVLNSKTLSQPREAKQVAQVPKHEENSYKISLTGVGQHTASLKGAELFPDFQEVNTLSQEEILKKRAERFGLSLDKYTYQGAIDGKAANSHESRVGITSNSETTFREPRPRRSLDLEIRRVLRETFGRTAIYETVKETNSGEHPLVSVCFIVGSVVGVGKGPTKSEARKAALKELLMNHRHLKKMKSTSQEKIPIAQVQDTIPVAGSHMCKEVSQDKNMNDSGIHQNKWLSSTKEASDENQGYPKELPISGSEEARHERKSWLVKPDQELQLQNKENKKPLNEKKRGKSPRGEHHVLQDASSDTAFSDQTGKPSHSSPDNSRWQLSPDLWTGSLRNGTPTGPSSSVFQPIDNARWKPSDDWIAQGNQGPAPTAKVPSTSNGTSATSPTNAVPRNLSSPRTVSPGVQLPGNPSLGNATLPGNQLPRNTSPQYPSQAENNAWNVNEITNSLANAQLAGTQSPLYVPVEKTTSEASEPSDRGGSPIVEVLGVPGLQLSSLQLPEEDEWDVYVSYIKSLSDFFVILIGDDFSEQLMVLEEEMRLFYQCSAWTLTEPPEEGDCCAAQFVREWLRVEVKSVQGDQVECFLLDHGDIETVPVSFLKPLSDTFLQLPFQVVRCKLAGSEQVAKDDQAALQMFCQLALGKNLLAEVASRDGDPITIELFDESDVSILEQSLTAGI